MSASSGGGGVYFYIVNGTTEMTLAKIDIYQNYPTTLGDFAIVLQGSSISKTRTSTGATTTSRSYGFFNSGAGVTMSGSQCSFKLSGYNSILSGSINGTINIYGIK